MLNINPDSTEESIRQLFRPYGVLSDIQIPNSPGTQRPIGVATLTFEKPESALLAMAELTGAMIDGRELRVGRTNHFPMQQPPGLRLGDGSRLFISNISPLIGEEQVASLFKSSDGFQKLSLAVSLFALICCCFAATDATWV